MVVVGLCGLIGAGKDSLARHLVTDHGFVRLSFASVLKDVVAALFGWHREMLEGDTESSREARERVDDWWARRLDIPDFSPRRALQLIGTDVFRAHFYEDIWVAALERRLVGKDRIVLTDCRFPNELELVRRHGGVVVHVRRPDIEPAWFQEFLRTGAADVVPRDTHVSEFAWALSRFDAVALNTSPQSLGEFASTLSSSFPR